MYQFASLFSNLTFSKNGENPFTQILLAKIIAPLFYSLVSLNKKTAGAIIASAKTRALIAMLTFYKLVSFRSPYFNSTKNPVMTACK